ncbi:lysophospholipid acyltransferase family protein [Pelodictyon luteolum]|nr:lysophospholipid acyltransferase family protein [Pelodictyon luteolum]
MALPAIISSRVLPAALRLLYRSLRLSVRPRGFSLPAPDESCIFAFWHGDMAVGWLFVRRLWPDRDASAVVSLSEDGSILSLALKRFGFRLIRGSSSKGGSEVRAAMQGALQRGNLVVLTPDGPRGPLHRFKYGTIRIASESGVPIIFARIGFTGGWQLKSWDRFIIPHPFSKVTLELHRLDVPRFDSEEKLRTYSELLSDRLGHA